jgi:hypothetical protein
MGRSRGGRTSKIHAVVDSNGLPTDGWWRPMTTGSQKDSSSSTCVLTFLV